MAKQRGRNHVADLGVCRPYDRISRSPAVKNGAITQGRRTDALEDLRREEPIQATTLMCGQHFRAAAVDGRTVRDVHYAIDRERHQPQMIVDENETVFA